MTEPADPRLALHKATAILSGRDADFAAEENGIGWNGMDTRFGHVLSDTDPVTWTPRMTEIAVKMLQKYRRQLTSAGFDMSTIPSVEDHAATQRKTFAAQIEEKIAAQRKVRRLSYDDARREFVLMFPFDQVLVDAVHASFPERRWNPVGDKTWRIPALDSVNAQRALDYAKNNGFGIDDAASQAAADLLADMAAEVAAVEEHVKASLAADADIEIAGLGGELRPFQKACAKYVLDHDRRVLIADDMGLGKTVEALAILQTVLTETADGVVLIVCPASLKLNWAAEAIRWLPEFVSVVGDSLLLGRWGRKRVRGVSILNGGREMEIRLDDRSTAIITVNDLRARILIINYDILDKHAPLLAKMKERGLLKAIVFDESHYAKNIRAQRTKLSIALADKVPTRLCLTGTPVMNKPRELISQLNILGRLDDFGGFRAFVRKYCAVDYHPSSNADPAGLLDLNRALRATCFVRRRKQDVLAELPPKVRSAIPVEISNRAEYDKAEAELIEYIRTRAMSDRRFRAMLTEKIEAGEMTEDEAAAAITEHANDKAERAMRAEVLVRIATLKQIAARGMLGAVMEWSRDFLETDEKLVLFGWHKEIVGALATQLAAPQITGDTPLGERADIVDRFQHAPEPRVVAMNLQAGGVGLTLTAASNVAMIEYGWNAATMDQAEDRCHRIGQKDTVTAWNFVAIGTIYEDIIELIEYKRKVAAACTDGVMAATISGQSVVSDLIHRLAVKAGVAQEQADETAALAAE